jgi:hypothetical protein
MDMSINGDEKLIESVKVQKTNRLKGKDGFAIGSPKIFPA